MSLKFDADIILIAGPTASGKTALAIEAAKANDAVIINTDSMQIYEELRILTARPTAEEEAQCPHYLFGQVSGKEEYSVGRWLEDVESILKTRLDSKKRIVFAGGTGLYFNNLVNGLSPIPEIDPQIRERWRKAVSTPSNELHRQLAEIDPDMAGELKPGDRQRIIRAMEVIESSGKSIKYWQSLPGKPVLPSGVKILKLLLEPARPALHSRIEKRFDIMIEAGALEEVMHLKSLDIPSDRPIMKAIGVPQLSAYMDGSVTFGEAVEKAKAATRQYAKRQSTWFRNSFDASWQRLDA